MRRYMLITMLLAMVLCTFAGCRSGSANNTNTTGASTAQTTTMPTMDNMLPGPEDTIDPSNGANQQDTTASEPSDTARIGCPDKSQRGTLPRLLTKTPANQAQQIHPLLQCRGSRCAPLCEPYRIQAYYL